MPTVGLRLLVGLLLSVLIGWVAYRRGSLTRSGWLGAVLTGTLTFGFGGFGWGAALITFFVTSTLLSRFKQRYKEQVAGEKFEKGGRRDLMQALANGGLGALLAVVFGLGGEAGAVLAAFAGALATVNADTWATELGVLNRSAPRLVTTMQPVAAGTSGAISVVGTLASAAGAATIGVALVVISGLERGEWHWWLVAAAVAGGVLGSLCDSVLGATVQAIYRGASGETERAAANGRALPLLRGWRWMNNDMVNFLSSCVGALVAALVAQVLR
jgi:uncharacterized protein (TIGR00297 family)